MTTTKVSTKKAAIARGKRLAMGELMGGSDPFSAIHWMKTLPKEWQGEVEDAIIKIYHSC